MATFDKFTGISVASGFKLQAKTPLDVRSVVDTIADRNALVTENGAYEGMVVYVKADKTLYQLKGTTTNDWEAVGGDISAEVEDLQARMDAAEGVVYITDAADNVMHGTLTGLDTVKEGTKLIAVVTGNNIPINYSNETYLNINNTGNVRVRYGVDRFTDMFHADRQLQIGDVFELVCITPLNGADEDNELEYQVVNSGRYFSEQALEVDWNGVKNKTNATTSAAGLMSKEDKTKLDSIAQGANKTVVDSALSSTSANPVQNKVINSALGGKVPTTRKVNNKALSADITLTASDVGAIPSSQKGAASGVAELDSTGKVPSSQLPSYVDDTIEGYLSGGKFYKESAHTTPITGESGKIYVDLATNKTYRWSGSAFVEISASLALGETSSTAYRGDRGKAAYDHSQAAHAPSNAERNVIVGIKKNGADLTPDSSRKVNIVTRDTYYGICSTALATTAKVATVSPSGFALTDGATVQIRFDNGLNGNSDITLNVNDTGAKFVSLNGVDGLNVGRDGRILDQKGTLTLTYWEQGDSYVINGIDTAYWLASVEDSLNQLKTSLNSDGAKMVTSTDWTDPDDNPSGTRYIALVNDMATDGIGASIGAVEGIALTDDNKIAASITGSAASLANSRYVDGVSFNGTANISHYTTCSTAAGTAAKTATCTGFGLVAGARITVKFTVTNTASSPTLNVNNTGAKNILYRGTAISAGYLAANRTYEFVYNGTAYELIGDVDTNTTYTNATTAKSGLMSATDKTKLDNIPEVYFSSSEPQSATPNSIWYEVI